MYVVNIAKARVFRLKESVDPNAFLASHEDYRKCDDPPSMDVIEDWIFDGECEATDGCIVEPDGHCPHGHPSWLIVVGAI